MVTEEAVQEALRQVDDPELGVNVWDLGLVYRIEIEDDRVEIDLTMTTPGCPAAGVILRNAEQAIRSVPGVKDAHVDLVFDPPWTPARMTDDIRQAFGFSL